MKKLSGRPCRRGGFTMAELMVAMCIGSVVAAVTIAGMIFIQKSYAATEQYALSMTDQMRVLDYLTMDLRRATTLDLSTANQVTITLPAYYSYGASDTTHQAPIPALATVSTDAPRAVYSSGSYPPYVQYRYDTASKQLQRREYYTDTNPASKTAPAWVTIASQLKEFPDITQPDSNLPGKYTISVSFSPTFQTLDTPNSNVITLTSTVYLRNS